MILKECLTKSNVCMCVYFTGIFSTVLDSAYGRWWPVE